ncbi:MAG: type II secretion system F family protein [Sedimentisphaerales bacterium]|jgi:general secretion pathway protein F|nr:type II secretion system F family protein [Sedimentisphaerales bacterium]HNY76693.1 type II secretion system F family protein [Sedimentisphaerales bacterium]HOC61700.1 type II secretion system F family protein [Sedimentisphaerales bacterium]HOH62532.1 type II secretion system F family protein [Sedimentisphaerales bacterium]HPY50005.1 type II secretion system F family protein [Sedimentisphaerales bacterium]
MPAVEPQIQLRLRRTNAPARPASTPGRAPRTQGQDLLRRASTRDLSRLARQLSTLLHAGMPLVPALSALVEQMQGTPQNRPVRWGYSADPLAPIVARVRDDVNAGSSLAEALGKHPHLFSPLFVNMVAAGETSGALEAVLARLADILEKRVQLTGKVKAAVAYPAMMAVVAVGVVLFLLSFVVPSISELFVKMNQELPLPTRILIGISSFARSHVVLILVAVGGMVAALVGLARTQDGRRWMDRIKLRLPLFGPLFFKLEVARLTRTLGTLMNSGIPVITAMEISQKISQNHVMTEATEHIKEGVHRGETIANAVRATGLFPPVVFHVIQTGQMTGTVEDGLLNIAEMYDGEVEATVRTLTALLEPMILLLMGGVVGFIVLSILLPIFEINQAL